MDYINLPSGDYTFQFVAETATEEQCSNLIEIPEGGAIIGGWICDPIYASSAKEYMEYIIIRSKFTDWQQYNHVILLKNKI